MILMRLLEIFQDFTPVTKGAGQFGKYEQTFKIVPKKTRPTLALEDLQNYVQQLQQRFPNRNFYLRHTHVAGKEYYVITRKCYALGQDGKQHRVWDRVPIYVDLTEQKFYIAQSYLKTRPKLVNFIVMRTLGALGISQSRYARREYQEATSHV
jgi:hypothetical protein